MDIIDEIFMNVNEQHKNNGTGMFFRYSLGIDDTKDQPVYILSIILKEMAHGERTLQAIPFQKPEAMDVYTMKYNVFVSVLSILTESTLMQWNELGKMLNTDIKMQDNAKKLMN